MEHFTGKTYQDLALLSYRYFFRVNRDKLISSLNISSSLLIDKLREKEVITQLEDEYIRGEQQETDCDRARRLIDLLLQKDDLERYRKLNQALTKSGQDNIFRSIFEANHLRLSHHLEADRRHFKKNAGRKIELKRRLLQQDHDNILSLTGIDDVEYQNNRSTAGPVRNKRKQPKKYPITLRQKNTKTDNPDPFDLNEIHLYLSEQPKQVIPVDLKRVKPGATLQDTLREQLRYCDETDILTIEWLLEVAPEQIVLVFMGKERYNYQSKNINQIMAGAELGKTKKVIIQTSPC